MEALTFTKHRVYQYEGDLDQMSTLQRTWEYFQQLYHNSLIDEDYQHAAELKASMDEVDEQAADLIAEYEEFCEAQDHE